MFNTGNSYQNTNVNPYQKTQVTSSNPEKILIMLYDGAINFTKIALDKMNKGDRAGKGKYIGNAQAIIAELMNTLNHDAAPVIAKDLERLYIYLIDEYIAANISNAPKHLDNVVRILTMMRDTWVDAVEVARKERTSGVFR
jgi:flagellar secretion chaperone FliS